MSAGPAAGGPTRARPSASNPGRPSGNACRETTALERRAAVSQRRLCGGRRGRRGGGSPEAGTGGQLGGQAAQEVLGEEQSGAPDHGGCRQVGRKHVAAHKENLAAACSGGWWRAGPYGAQRFLSTSVPAGCHLYSNCKLNAPFQMRLQYASPHLKYEMRSSNHTNDELEFHTYTRAKIEESISLTEIYKVSKCTHPTQRDFSIFK